MAPCFSHCHHERGEKLKGEAEAEVVVAVVRRIPVAIGYTAVPGVVVPAATTVHTVRARGLWEPALL